MNRATSVHIRERGRIPTVGSLPGAGVRFQAFPCRPTRGRIRFLLKTLYQSFRGYTWPFRQVAYVHAWNVLRAIGDEVNDVRAPRVKVGIDVEGRSMGATSIHDERIVLPSTKRRMLVE